MAELGADRSLRRRSVIALIEQQIERPVDGRKSRRELGRRGTSNSRFDVASSFFARVIRFSIAAWLLTKALAISSTLKPHRM